MKRLLLILVLSLFALWPRAGAWASCVCLTPSDSPTSFPCTFSTTIGGLQQWWDMEDFNSTQKNFLTNDFYQKKIIDELWKRNLQPALKAMTAQLTAARLYNAGMIGTMMDGQAAVETQLTMQRLEAEAYRDYTPGEGLCRLGTNVRSLAASQDKSDAAHMALDQLAFRRMMNHRGGPSEGGTSSDALNRFKQYQRLYCNPGDNNGLMKSICYPKAATPASSPARFNRDIDIARTLLHPLTLNLDYSNDALSSDEEDVLALSANLYGFETIRNIPPAAVGPGANDEQKSTYLDLRQFAAIRGAAQNSFNAIAAQKAKGSGASYVYMTNALMELGFSRADAIRFLSSDTNEPSYYAQMEILTKKVYQNPNFYVNLIDKPANVKRQLAAMKAIELMQNRDLFESLERQEILLSLLLELDIRAEQSRLTNEGSE
jgi:hypothetical protein